MLARWAANCAAAVLPMFEQAAEDPRPRKAIEIGRAWALGKVRTGAAMKASVAAHAAARSVQEPLAVAAARAAGQAVATAHCADHCMGALLYVLKIRKLSGQGVEKEMKKQISKLPGKLQSMVQTGVGRRLGMMGQPLRKGSARR